MRPHRHRRSSNEPKRQDRHLSDPTFHAYELLGARLGDASANPYYASLCWVLFLLGLLSALALQASEQVGNRPCWALALNRLFLKKRRRTEPPLGWKVLARSVENRAKSLMVCIPWLRHSNMSGSSPLTCQSFSDRWIKEKAILAAPTHLGFLSNKIVRGKQ